ncbi:DUF2332 domain-containing protein [Microbacterium sp. SSM24]|uniref:DUF2332 domain-containing protein n=1 Tax=Microbacterium sp. SSM24 TaxID=2991714 RepID=UPI002226DB80|nr:DUF2332 domain-containing protein [Microbacterium sp. SSM24]MCW3493834.1 DUF2332 domain-containing protein [Microbacterium sp. SSM24]
MGTDQQEQIAAYYDDFARRWAHCTSPLYEDWALGIARDPEVLARLTALPHAKRQANLVFAAARWEGAPLSPYHEVRPWLLEHWDRIVATGAARTVQTNEANRCATWLPPLSRIDGPLALLEVGAAAGLCLFPDRYSVDYATPSGIRRVDPPAGPSEVVLSCRVDDQASVPARYPDVVSRRGIDLDPIDAGDPDAVDWLATLVWPGPDHDARVARLRAAAAIAAADPPVIERGDLRERVTDAASAAPADATVVVFHSAVLLYLDAEGRREFADLMAGLGDRIGRRVVWLSNETLGTLPEIDARVPAGTATDHRFVQTWDARPIALAGQHGATYETAPFRA